MATSRTIGPLHFEDLEPKRFEDLVRQLVYDFKNWRRLEATGRAGSDDGFDARGYEIAYQERSTEEDNESEDVQPNIDRLWLIQCKREKSITPRKLSSYMEQINLQDSDPLYGIIFVAACDFSKKSRDEYRKKCEEIGVEEWHIWGKAEIEDLLFLPKNDHLLFAYFGISLTLRRKNKKSEISQMLATKRKAFRTLGGKEHSHILLRDVSDKNYPTPPDNHEQQPKWILAQYRESHAKGLIFLVNRYFAYLNRDPVEWDAALSYDNAPSRDDPWSTKDDLLKLRGEIFEFWNLLPEPNRAWLEILALVPYESIIAIDELGDNYHQEPHIYIEFNNEYGPFSGYAVNVSSGSQWDRFEFSPESPTDKIVKKFPEHMRRNIDANPYSPKKLLGL